MSAAVAILDELRQRGVEVRVDGSRLLFRPVDRVPPELLIQLRIRKAELMKILQDELPSWADPQNPDVRAARAEAECLGVLDVTFPPNPALAEARWMEGAALDRLPERLQGCVVAREGWAPTRWAKYLSHRARLCDDQHRDVAELYEQAADLLCRGTQGNG